MSQYANAITLESMFLYYTTKSRL